MTGNHTSNASDAENQNDAAMESAPNGQPEATLVKTDTPRVPDDAADSTHDDSEDAPAEPDDGDSEAETLIQSPEKLKQRAAASNASVAGSVSTSVGPGAGAGAIDENNLGSRKRKRSLDDVPEDAAFSTSSRRSSPLSSPRIPPQSHDSDSDVSRSSHIPPRRTNPARRKQADNESGDSDDAAVKPVRIQTRKRRPSDLLPPISKHRTKNTAGGADAGNSERRETRSATYPRHMSEERSTSPKPATKREHRRGVSTQLTQGDVDRRKRGRPPAIQTKRAGSAENNHSGDSSSDESDSPNNQSRPALHKFSSVDHDTMSPAKATGTRKVRDKNGRTFLSRAAASSDLELAKVKYAERPEDLNVSDNAGNTPLQIAALQGFVEIVRFLLEQGCDVDTRNIDRDTALIDAVENGHVKVVQLLLKHGANPRLGNAKGDEPYELVPQDDDNYDEIRRLLAEAKDKPANRRISSEHNDASRDGHSSRAASAASPRDSPPIMGPRSPPTGTGRRRTGRSESTRNDLLWQASTQENLKKLASQGDVQGVANILNVLQKAETESLIAAAKAGHEEVLQYLLAMGDTEPDPDPIRHLKLGYNTPLLAAIGRGHPEVVKLLVEQSGFNPMRKLLKGKTYYEIAAERRGEQWQKEHQILKTAYEKYAVKHRKATSPRATRDVEKNKARATRRSQSPVSSKLRNSSSPTMTQKHIPGKSPRSVEKEKDRDFISADGSERRKHLIAKRDLAETPVAVSSDQEQTANTSLRHNKRRSQSDLPPPSNLESDATHRRRRLVTGKEHRRRRSNVEGSSDEEMTPVKNETRVNAPLKRTRASMSPEPSTANEGENGRSAAKKRRTIIESSPEETRPGPTAAKRQSTSPARRRKVVAEASTKSPAPQAELPAPEDPSSAMELDKPEELAPEDATAVEKVADSDVPLERIETAEVIKVEPADTGPSEDELRLQREEEEQRKAEEAQRIETERLAAEKAVEAQRQAEIEAAQKAEEMERLRAAEVEAESKRKEEEERQERIRREHEERLRKQEEAIKEQERRRDELRREQQQREQLETERRRIDTLPALLKHSAMLINNNDPKVRSPEWIKLFLPLYTVKTVQLDPTTTDSTKEDLWIPNFQAAGLLATKDLNLRSYTSLERRPTTDGHRLRLWAVSRNNLSYEFATNQWNTTVKQAIQREMDERPKFYAMEELFWVKVCLDRSAVSAT
jgi:hypothetical protein